MRAVFILVLSVLLVVALLVGGFVSGSGYVLVAFADTTIEMSLIVALLIFFIFVVASFFFLLFIRALLHTRRGLRDWAVNLRRRRGLNKTTQGLIAFVEGRWEPARKSLSKAAANSSTPLVNYLFAARASAAVGDVKAVDGFLKQAELSTEGADIAIGLTQAELQLKNHQFEQALATLLRVKKSSGLHPVVLKMLASVYQELNDWPNLLKLMPQLKKSNAMTEDEHSALESKLVCAMLLESVEKEQLPDQLLACWKQLPGSVKKNEDVIACYAEQLISVALLGEAERLLRQELQRKYSPVLAAVYGFAGEEPFQKQQAFAERLLKSHPSDAVLLLSLGRICLRSGNNDEAITYFQKSITLRDSLAANAELASVYAATADYQRSNQYYARALMFTGQVNSETKTVAKIGVEREALGANQAQLHAQG